MSIYTEGDCRAYGSEQGLEVNERNGKKKADMAQKLKGSEVGRRQRRIEKNGGEDES